MITSAAEVIRQHAALVTRWRSAPHMLCRYIESFADDVQRKRGSHAMIDMFWPLKDPRYADEWVRLAGRDLFRAQVFHITPEMCHVTTQLYHKTASPTGENISTVTIRDLPSEAGFAWLDDPPMLLDRKGLRVTHRALSWCVNDFDDTSGQLVPALRVIIWADTRVRDDYSDQWDPRVEAKSESQLGRLQLSHVFTLPLNYPVKVDTESKSDDVLLWFRTMCTLLGTEIVVRSRPRLPNSLMGELRGRVKHPEVTVVTLRRAVHSPGDDDADEPSHVDWSCRWLVQGHHRHLEAYDTAKHHATPKHHDRGACAVCGKRITWVRPFVKGPDGLPVKSVPVLYRLSR